MAGKRFPLVMFPRYTTLSGGGEFTTIGVDVSLYETAVLNVWRNVVLGSTGTFAAVLEESSDRNEWELCQGSTGNWDPGDDTEGQITATLNRRYMRLRISTVGSDSVVTTYAFGYLVRRQR